MLTSPAFPIASELTELEIKLRFPSTEIESVALMVTVPAFPSPEVLLLICPPLVRFRLVVSMFTTPPFPSAPEFT